MKRFKKILKKIKELFNKLLGKEKHLLLEESKYRLKVSKYEEQEEKDTITDKKEFFNLYQNIKSGNIFLENLMLEDLIKVLLISQEELQIDNERISNLESELDNLNTEKNSFI